MLFLREERLEGDTGRQCSVQKCKLSSLGMVCEGMLRDKTCCISHCVCRKCKEEKENACACFGNSWINQFTHQSLVFLPSSYTH